MSPSSVGLAHLRDDLPGAELVEATAQGDCLQGRCGKDHFNRSRTPRFLTLETDRPDHEELRSHVGCRPWPEAPFRAWLTPASRATASHGPGHPAKQGGAVSFYIFLRSCAATPGPLSRAASWASKRSSLLARASASLAGPRARGF